MGPPLGRGNEQRRRHATSIPAAPGCCQMGLQPHKPFSLICQVVQEKEAPAQKRRRLNGSRKQAQDEPRNADAGLEDEDGAEGDQVISSPLGADGMTLQLHRVHS